MSDVTEPGVSKHAIHLALAVNTGLRNLDNIAAALDRLLGQVDEREWAAAKYDDLHAVEAGLKALRDRAQSWGQSK